MPAVIFLADLDLEQESSFMDGRYLVVFEEGYFEPHIPE